MSKLDFQIWEAYISCKPTLSDIKFLQSNLWISSFPHVDLIYKNQIKTIRYVCRSPRWANESYFTYKWSRFTYMRKWWNLNLMFGLVKFDFKPFRFTWDWRQFSLVPLNICCSEPHIYIYIYTSVCVCAYKESRG